LGNKSFCNLTETDISKFKGDTAGLHDAIRLAARANYRQTCVNLKDGILQEAWHLNNYFLRLCGVGLTGIAMRPDMNSYDYEYLKRTATSAAISMADELGLPRPKNVTCVNFKMAQSKSCELLEPPTIKLRTISSQATILWKVQRLSVMEYAQSCAEAQDTTTVVMI
jgi:ribonucleoside-triphosphate reductase